MNRDPDIDVPEHSCACLDGRGERLRANGRGRFLLTAPPLRLPCAAGSPTTPVATV